MAVDDYYELLGIQPTADDDELRRAWRELAKRWHPDRAGPDVTFVFQKLSAAYAVLSDPVERARYDRERTGTSDPTPGRAPSVMIRRLCAPLNALLARGVARHADDGIIELFLLDDEFSEGGMVTISMRVPVRDANGTSEEVFAAWLAIRPGVADGTVLTPSAQLPNVIRPVVFRVRHVPPGTRREM